MARKVVNPNGVSREIFLQTLAEVRQKYSSDYDLAVKLGVQPRQLYRWRQGIGPTHTHMVELTQQLLRIGG